MSTHIRAALERLLPCPFCGSEASLEDERLRWVVRCAGCSACVLGDRAPEPEQEPPESYWAPFRQSAVDCWNRRPAIPPAPEPGEVGEIADHILAELQGFHLRHRIFGELTVSRLTRAATLLQQQQHLLGLACQELDNFMEQQQTAPAPVVDADVRYEFSVFDGDDCEQAGDSAPTLDDAIRAGGHYLSQYNREWDPHRLELRRVETIPLPQVGEGEG